MGKFFNKGLKEEGKKEKIIEGKNEEQLKAIKNQGKKQLDAIKSINRDSKPLKVINFFGKLSPEAKELMNEIREVENDIDSEKLVCAKSVKKSFNFNVLKLLFKFSANIYDGKIILEEAKKDQHKKFNQLEDLKKFDPNNPGNIREKEETLINTEKVYNNRNNVNNAFENEVFPFKDGLKKKRLEMSDTLQDWVRVDKKRFTTIKNNVKRVRDKNKFIIPGRSGSRIYVNDLYYQIRDIEHGEITYEEALEIMLKIRNDIEKNCFSKCT